jgi:N-acetyl-gamma-glutamyl-phosphate reductase
MQENDSSKNTTKAQNLTTVSVVGARGYSGLELTRLLLQHPGVQLTHCFATQSFSLEHELLEDTAKNILCLPEHQLLQNLTDVVFLATPAEVSLKLAPQILSAGKRVIDLSGAFRLKKSDYARWYSFAHTAPQILTTAEYGLVPFAGPAHANSQFIANPGCYATAISMALIPLLKKDLISTENIVIDAKSGTTGAGKKAAENLLFSEVSEDCLPYRVGQHQHLPEILETIEHFTGKAIDPHFTTHLLPIKRGIIAGIYANAKTTSLSDIEQAFAEEYAGYKLVRFGKDLAKLASLNKITKTPYIHISYELVGAKLYVFSVIDNLLKGAASQAIENLNRLLDLPTHFSLTTAEK